MIGNASNASNHHNGTRYALTCDVGTTALKGALVRGDGTIAASASEPLDLLIDGDRREQDPRQWWEAFRAVTRRMMEAARAGDSGFAPGRIEGLIFSGQMQDLIALDADLEPVRGAILYSDGRAAAQAEALADSLASRRRATRACGASWPSWATRWKAACRCPSSCGCASTSRRPSRARGMCSSAPRTS